MNADVKRRWVAALRSGEYRQGRNCLHSRFNDASRPDEYCCLGVLCALAAADGVVQPAVGSSVVTYDGYRSYLPPVVAVWAGLSSYDPVVYESRLSAWNDGDCDAVDVARNFDQIATAIEEQL